MKPRILLAMLLMALLLALGCSDGNKSSVVTDPGFKEKSADSGKSNIMLLGFYTMKFNPGSGELEVTPHREAYGVMNALQYLEPPVDVNITVDMSTIVINAADQTVHADLSLHHPYANTKYTGFEMRGVIFGPELRNADGKTRWMNPVEFSGLPWGYRNYSKGTSYNGTNFQRLHNGYKLFMESIPNPLEAADMENGPPPTGPYNPENTSFGPGDVYTSHYFLDWTNSDDPWLVFQLGIIANWANPSGPGPYVPSDFPPMAHCPEPFLVQATVYDNNLFQDPTGAAGTEFSLTVKVYDMRDPGANDVVIESADLGIPPTSPTSDFPGELPFEHNYIFTDISALPSPPGDHPLQVTVIDPMTYGQAYFASSMPAAHPLHGVQIQVPLETELTVSPDPYDIFLDQIGYLTWDPVLGGDGKALVSIIFDGRATEANSVDLDTGPFGLGILNAPATKGEGGFQFVIDNTAGVGLGNHSLNFVVNTMAGPIGGVFNAVVVAPPAVPPPFWTHSVMYGTTNIGSVEVGTFTASACGVNIEKNFTPNGTDNDCAEYRWIQVISTDTPISANAPNSYVDPYGNDDPPGPHANDPYYWTDGEANGQNTAGAGQPRNPTFSDRPRRPPPPKDKEPLWWHAELVLVCVRPGQPDVLLHSEHYYFFKDADGTVHEGHYDGTDGGSAHLRNVLARDFPGYSFT